MPSIWSPAATTPTPWVNVMANPHFGAMVSESGLGFTWRGNSQQNRLTPWHNDPGQRSAVRESSICATTKAARSGRRRRCPFAKTDAYRARHGQGYTVFEHNSHAIGQELTVFVPAAADGGGDPVKMCRLRLRNDSSRARRLTVTYFAEWVLGPAREDQQLHVQTSHDDPSGAVLARQSWSGSAAGADRLRRGQSAGGVLLRRSHAVPGPQRVDLASRGAWNESRLDNRSGRRSRSRRRAAGTGPHRAGRPGRSRLPAGRGRDRRRRARDREPLSKSRRRGERA